MAETIESFVAKLKAEGVEAGKETAEKLKAEAEGQAKEIVQRAEAQAEKIVADARAEAESVLSRSRTELELAARDATLKLRAALSRALGAVLLHEVKERLSDADFLKELIREVVLQYVRADAEGAGSVEIALPPDMKDRLSAWAVGELKKAAGKGAAVDLKATLGQAGFEYTVSGGTVEVTADAVVETLRELVGASLRETLERAAAGRKE